MLKKILILMAFTSLANAQPYVGGAIGHSHLTLPESLDCDTCSTHTLSTSATVGEVFVGYNFGRYFAVEGGIGSLSRYHSHNVGPLPSGVQRDIHQDISTDMLYFRGLAFLPISEHWRLFTGWGVLSAKMKNHEYGFNDPSRKFVEQINYDRRDEAMKSIGIEYRATERVSIRAEAMKVQYIAVSHWTLSQEVTVGWLGLWVNF